MDTSTLECRLTVASTRLCMVDYSGMNCVQGHVAHDTVSNKPIPHFWMRSLRLDFRSNYRCFICKLMISMHLLHAIVCRQKIQELIRRRESERERFYNIAHVEASAYAH